MIFLGVYAYAVFGFVTFVALSEKVEFTTFTAVFWSMFWPVIWSISIVTKLASMVLY